MYKISVLLGKTIFIMLRALGKTGSAFPGYVIEKTDKNFLKKSLSSLPQGVIVVSGTNGKTTTTKMITSLLENQGHRVLTNRTGSNFVRGIISVVIDHASWAGKLHYDIAVFEQDEAHAVHFVRQVRPRGAVILNIMRDQMDRFGEIDTTLRMLRELAESVTDFAVLNVNDHRVSSIQTSKAVKRIGFGHAKSLQSHFVTDDEMHHGNGVTFFENFEPTVMLQNFDQNSFQLMYNKQEYVSAIRLTGGHNALNAAAAVATLAALDKDVPPSLVQEVFSTLEPAFGRGEKWTDPISGLTITIQLVKNPAGFSHSLQMLELNTYKHVGIAIHDNYPDGRDVSWLWDVDFSILAEKKRAVRCGGTRAADMAVRLKYDEVKILSVDSDVADLVSKLQADCNQTQGHAVLFCTYTAMLRIRGILFDTTSGLDES